MFQHDALDDARPATAHHAPPRILVVEDDPDVLDYVAAVLCAAGYDVMEAPDAESALATLESCAGIGMIVSDIGLPGGLDGIDLVCAAQRDRPDIRVLLMSGNPGALTGTRDLPDGGFELIRKPFMPRRLTDRVRAILAAG